MSKSFWAPWMVSVIMVIFLTPTVVRACSRPRYMDIISASVEVTLVVYILDLCVIALFCQMCEMAETDLSLTPPSVIMQM